MCCATWNASEVVESNDPTGFFARFIRFIFLGGGWKKLMITMKGWLKWNDGPLFYFFFVMFKGYIYQKSGQQKKEPGICCCCCCCCCRCFVIRNEIRWKILHLLGGSLWRKMDLRLFHPENGGLKIRSNPFGLGSHIGGGGGFTDSTTIW